MEHKWERMVITVEVIKNGYLVQANISDGNYAGMETPRVYCPVMQDVHLEASTIVERVDQLWATLPMRDGPTF